MLPWNPPPPVPSLTVLWCLCRFVLWIGWCVLPLPTARFLPDPIPSRAQGSPSTSLGSGRPRGGGVEKPARPFSCSICDATFRQRAHQEKHISAVHLKEKPHWCTRCAARFGRRSDLNKHTRLVHLKQRPFSCPYPSCEQRFGQKCDWKKHLLTHQRGTRRAASAGARIPPGRGFGTGGWGAGDSVGGLLGGPAGGAEAAGAGSGGGLISTLGGSGVDGTGGGGAGVGGAGVGGAGVGGASVGGAGGGGAGGDGVGGGGGGVSAAEELDTSGQGRQRDVANDGHAEDEVIDSEDRTLDQLPR